MHAPLLRPDTFDLPVAPVAGVGYMLNMFVHSIVPQ